MQHLLILFGLFIPQYVGAGTYYLQWPKKYHLKATLNIPSAKLTQPYEVWWNGDTGNHRFDFYEGMTKLYEKKRGKDAPYRYIWVGPESTNIHHNNIVCRRLTNASREVKMLRTYLPPKCLLADKGQEGNETKWEYQFKGSYGEIYSYAVWTTGTKDDWVPVRYEYRILHRGVELDFIQHIYEKFRPTKQESTVFRIPGDLKCKRSPEENFLLGIHPMSAVLGHNMTEEFERFKSTHHKYYKTEDEHFVRFNVFQKNFRYIQSVNRQQGSYKLAVNRFTDLTENELTLFLGTKIDPKSIDLSAVFEDDDKGGDDFDWRQYNAVTPPKDQTILCGSCYAFGTAATVESAAYISKGCTDMEEASEQALIDCSRGIGNSGCNGGFLYNSLKWVKVRGIPFKSDYGPYLAMESFCNVSQSRFLHISGYEKMPKTIESVKNGLRQHGPLLAAINLPYSMFFYAEGIYDDKNCLSDPQKGTHAVVIVGYGKQNGRRYWLIKNSFGTQWGDGGYFKLSMDNNLCGVTNTAYAVVHKNSLVQKCKLKNIG